MRLSLEIKVFNVLLPDLIVNLSLCLIYELTSHGFVQRENNLLYRIWQSPGLQDPLGSQGASSR